MWIMFNDAFLSIVDKSKMQGHLLVRARRPGDIEKIFPGITSRESFGTDYRYRADVPRTRVATAIGELVMTGINYRNFKSSTKDKPLHDAYMGVWNVMERLQPGGAYARRDAPQRPRQRVLAEDWLSDGGDPFFGDPFFDDEGGLEPA